MSSERVRGFVAQILDSQTLVINRGAEHGVIEGMRFAVLNRQGQEISDPETGEPLGSVDIDKTIVKVVRIQEKLSVAKTFRRFTTPGGPLWATSMGQMSRPPSTRTETLRVDEAKMKAELDETESLVKVGDPVVEVRGDEYGSENV